MDGPQRISDVEREQAVDRLRTACGEGRLTLDEFSERVGSVYGATTSTDLDVVTGDLPPIGHAPAERSGARWTVGVLSGARRSGRWHPARPTTAIAVFGSCQLDLSDAESTPAAGDDGADATIEVTAVAVFGGIEIVVPQGVAVDLGGFAVFGSKSYRVRGDQPPPGAPLVRVSSRAVFGGVTVRTRPFTAGRP